MHNESTPLKPKLPQKGRALPHTGRCNGAVLSGYDYKYKYKYSHP